MTDLLHQEAAIRLGCFLAVLLPMMLWEWRQPRRSLSLPRARRWPANLGIIVVDSLVVRLVLCTGFTIRRGPRKPTAILASTCRGGTGCSGLIGISPATVTPA